MDMIDDKKTEEAARGAADLYEQDLPIMSYNEDTEVDGQHHFCQEFGAELFKDGARWAINEFLKDLWHPYDEVPTIKDSNILQFFESYGAGSEDDFDEYFELANTREGFTQETWEEFMNEGGVPSKWLYIDDLMPKKGD